MLYSARELDDWWKAVPAADKREVIERMVDRAMEPGFRSYAESLLRKLEQGREFTTTQLEQIRKWVRQ